MSWAACQGFGDLFVPSSSVGTVGQAVPLSSVGTCGPVVPLLNVRTSGHVLLSSVRTVGAHIYRLCVLSCGDFFTISLHQMPVLPNPTICGNC